MTHVLRFGRVTYQITARRRLSRHQQYLAVLRYGSTFRGPAQRGRVIRLRVP